MNDFIRLRISKEDKEVLQDIATKNRMSLSSYVRTRIDSIVFISSITKSPSRDSSFNLKPLALNITALAYDRSKRDM